MNGASNTLPSEFAFVPLEEQRDMLIAAATTQLRGAEEMTAVSHYSNTLVLGMAAQPDVGTYRFSLGGNQENRM